MVQSLSITDAITSISQVQEKLGVRRTELDSFFPEWCADLPELSEVEQERLRRFRQKWLYQYEDGVLIEETVKMLVLSPLLDLAGFYDPPFRFKTEVPAKFELEESNEVLQGRVDALVFQQHFWTVVVEAKRTSVSAEFAIPQTLAYMMATPHPDRPAFGMITNGTNFIFLKLLDGNYDVSRVFSLLLRQSELFEVSRILKRIGNDIVPDSAR